VTDIFRYEAHAVEETPFPTDGHDEVLVWVDTVADVPPGSSTAIDASDLVVVDHSPSTYGAEPPLVERTLSLQATAQGFGFPGSVGSERYWPSTALLSRTTWSR